MEQWHPDTLHYEVRRPPAELSDLVESFWTLRNETDVAKPIVLLPDGRFDLLFGGSATEPFHVTLTGLGTEPTRTLLDARTVLFAVSFRLLALEYLLDTTITMLTNSARRLSPDTWGITAGDLTDLNQFSTKLSVAFLQRLPLSIDQRKQTLFSLLYASNGALSIRALSENTGWSRRQINRYFTKQVGISAKAYCTILRFRASLPHLRAGRLFPEENFADQAHFIKEVRKFAGVTPKELTKNEDDRFIQLATLPGR